MNFFAPQLKLLGHVIDERGIVMDPHKVNKVANWKVPTNKSLLSSFLGAVGYLAADCKDIRIPMAVLNTRAGSTRLWQWGATEQRAFDEVKRIVEEFRDSHRVALDYAPTAEQINVVTDACLTGGSGILSQGEDLQTAKIISFWSGKFSSAQQNYPVHEQELLAIVESLKRFRPQLLGVKFRICTDHKALEHIMTQRHLSPRQHRWVDILNQFDFTIYYIPGETNTMADALSRIYSDEPEGVVRATSEYITDTDHGELSNIPLQKDTATIDDIFSTPVYTVPVTAATISAMADIRRSNRLANKPRHTWNKNHERSDPQSIALEDERTAIVQIKPSLQKEIVDQKLLKKQGESDNIQQDNQSEDELDILPELISDTEDPVFFPRNGEVIEQENNVAPSEKSMLENTLPENEDITPPHLTELMSNNYPAIQLPKDLKGCYVNDKFFAQILANTNHYKDFEVSDGLIFLKRDDRKLLCIPDIKIGERNIREIVISHAHSILAHLGARKTLFYLRENVWWPHMIKDITDFCRSCGLCAMSKSSTQQPMGLLRTLEIPKRPWQAIGIDFVGPLPASKNRNGEFDQICVIIDHLTSMVHLVPTKITYKAKQIAEIIFENVYKLHGLPERIISDRDSLFTSVFWQELHKLLGTEIRLSSSYHPQTDGATERANRTMTQMLRQCVALDQKDWVSRLPAIEYAMNCARSDTTGFSPFYLNYGQMPRPLIWDSNTEYPGVSTFAQRMKETILAAHDEVIEARVKQTRQANRHRRAANFAEGDLVYLSTKNLKLPKHRARKLSPKYIGPFRIVKVVEPGASYKLELSDELKKRGINETFHASLLRIHVPNDDRRFPGRQLYQIPGFGEHPKEWAVDRVLSHSGQGTEANFEVQWMTGDVTWLSYAEAKHLEPLTAYCEAMGIQHPKDLPNRMSDLPKETIGVAYVELTETSETQPNKYLNKHFRYKGTRQSTQSRPTHEYSQMSHQTPPNSTRSAEASFSADSLAILLAAQRDAYAVGANAIRYATRLPPHVQRRRKKGKKGNKNDNKGKKGKDVPLKDRVDGDTTHLPKPLGKRGPSKAFKDWSSSEPGITEFIERLINNFAQLCTVKEKPHELGTEIMVPVTETPVAGPSNTNHGNTPSPETNDKINWGLLNANESVKNVPDESHSHTANNIHDVEMDEFDILLGEGDNQLSF